MPEEKNSKYIPYQLCPKCEGQGIVSRPPWIAGDVYEWSSSATSFTCDVCNGAKIIPMCEVPEPDLLSWNLELAPPIDESHTKDYIVNVE